MSSFRRSSRNAGSKNAKGSVKKGVGSLMRTVKHETKKRSGNANGKQSIMGSWTKKDTVKSGNQRKMSLEWMASKKAKARK
ncbi:hypothetical protein AGABI1DRAFT_81869 [Agaricus bisporus var. burnettii JB137-S8]|uniref:Uncharacterized protein n=1 Tax=Agaricus bisporus var. burnettii (strain JB137-S8 / ATCC MYA-4627 / FGSC 10392) TaxID=597362 RepID=K5XL95_AGABU|nr:uncharacterized protein AGABI1DRAFT_81869 [Agaricus bisporus var. burnettii JB137-S8]EKM84172.1 hypothetical protein AGABI1DRAFT_81869 [Agaricus bisporus var. burnettii JB137-S8]